MCRRVTSFICLLFIALFLASCNDGPQLAATDAPPTKGLSPRLQAGDKIKITVYGEERITGEYQLDTGGYVSVPLAGTVLAAGLTKGELERSLSKKLGSGGYVRNPAVTVDILTTRPFFVLGEVERPGQYPYQSGLNVVSAMAVAGGNTYRASKSYVLIQRAGEPDFREYPMSPMVEIFPGDLMRVPERYF